MIVVDTNVIAYLFLPGDHTESARRTLERDPAWTAPLLWRSELRNVLATSLHHGHVRFDEAIAVMNLATEVMAGGEYEVDSGDVLRLVAESPCSAYDCEFVALAQELGVPLVTADRRIRRSFERTAVALQDYGER